MTDEEVVALKPGDMVDANYGKAWVRCRVVAKTMPVRGYRVRVRLRPIGQTAKGYLRPEVWREPARLRPNPERDGHTANVFADFLEERGEMSAARLLRETFPLVPD